MEPFLGQISIFPSHFIPKGWAACDGQLLSVDENQWLYALLGNRFGGTEGSTFALPDLRGRVPIGSSDWQQSGQMVGQEMVVLSEQTTPKHNHLVRATTSVGDSPTPQGGLIGALPDNDPVVLYGKANAHAQVQLHESTIGETGYGEMFTNIQPSLVLNFCIAIEGAIPFFW
ncbi:phage tail protein [Rhodospirillum sp. A1_3_36]|uniref:phage tail protein n=1 Tax=Rhodospirillum sp. A1_3_36 TaxID=3391666 RepID=UPI0039A66619